MRCQDVHPSLKYHLLSQAVDEHAEAGLWVLGLLEGNDYQIKVGVSLAGACESAGDAVHEGCPTRCAEHATGYQLLCPGDASHSRSRSQ